MFQFKITLKNTGNPRVWRQITLPDAFSFHDFHRIIQAAFGWRSRRLYAFMPTDRYSEPFIALPTAKGLPAKKITDSTQSMLKDIFTNEGQQFIYIYDFGDEWVHKIMLEQIVDAPDSVARCLNGRGACPPENCGGALGYKELKCIFDPKYSSTKQTQEIRELFGWEKWRGWDPNLFDLKAADTRVQSASRLLLQASPATRVDMKNALPRPPA
jgi:hypothetical protein